MIPTVYPRIESLLVDWSDFVAPDDQEFYRIVYGTSDPPTIKWGDTFAQQITILGLTPGVTYYVQVFAFDCFGSGQGSGIASGTPLAGSGPTTCAPCRALRTSIIQVGSQTMTLAYQDIMKATIAVSTGQIVGLHAGGDFAHTVDSVGYVLIQRRVSGGGGVTVELRSSGVVIPSTNDVVTGHVNLLDVPDTGVWEYVLMAKSTVAGIPFTSGFIDILVEQ